MEIMKKIIRNFSKIIYNNSPFSAFLFFIFIFISTFLIFFIISILQGYEVNVLEKLIVNSYDLEMKKKDGSYFKKYNEIEEYLIVLQKDNIIKDFDMFNASQALIKSKGYFTGVNIISFENFENISKKINSQISPVKGRVYIGIGLKEDFGINKGDRIEISNLEEKMMFSVNGFFETGISDMDNMYIIMEKSDFYEFYIIPDSFEKIGINLNLRKNLFKIKNSLIQKFDYIDIVDIYKKNSTFISAINMEKLISVVIAIVIFFLFFLASGMFIIAKLNNFRKEFAFLIITGLKIKNMAFGVWLVFSGMYLSSLIFSVLFSIISLHFLDGRIAIPKDVYFIDKLYLIPDYFFINIFLALNVVFVFLIYFIFLNFFKSIKVDEELRSS